MNNCLINLIRKTSPKRHLQDSNYSSVPEYNKELNIANKKPKNFIEFKEAMQEIDNLYIIHQIIQKLY